MKAKAIIMPTLTLVIIALVTSVLLVLTNAGTKDKIAVPLRRKVKNVRKKNLDIMFEKNPYRLQCRKGLYRL